MNTDKLTEEMRIVAESMFPFIPAKNKKGEIIEKRIGQKEWGSKKYSDQINRYIGFGQKVLEIFNNPSLPKEIDAVEFGEWQLCPMCFGSGIIGTSGITSSTFQACTVCNGYKVLAKPIIPKP